MHAAPRTPSTGARTNLPHEVTSFVGREREIAEVVRLLGTTRLLTLTGAGGCGKTRLALRIADGLVDAYPDGVWLVELAALADASLVERVVGAVFQVPETPGLLIADGLTAWLRTKSALLLLDNCEHVVTAAAELVDHLLRGCPGLQVLATSRESLESAGETTFRVPSLALPPFHGQLSAETWSRYEAVQLFSDRALAALPSFVITRGQALVIAEICQRLDGIPLAIELAAARVRVLSVEQIAARLDDRFRLLTTGRRTAMPRQRTLRAAVDWSYALLSDPERALLRRLAVFAGGWTLEAAEAVGSGDGIEPHTLFDLFAQLVEKSLVLAEGQGGVIRYRLLETIRQYAQEKLVEACEEATIRDRHLAYFLQMAEANELRLRNTTAPAAVEQLEAEHDNLRAALACSLVPNQPGDLALRLSGALTWFWWQRSYHGEGYRWLSRALVAAPARSPARMKALYGAGWLAHHLRDLATARELLGESLDIAREGGDRWAEAWVLHTLGRVAYFDNDPASARAFGEQSLAIARGVGDEWLIAYALHLLGLAAYISADYATARTVYESSLAIRRRLDYREGIGILLNLIALVAVREGNLLEAQALCRETLATMQEVEGPWSVGMQLATFAYIAAAGGQPIRAARCGGAVATLAETYQTPLIPLFEPILADGLAIAREALGDQAFAAGMREGREMPLGAAIAEALAVEIAQPSVAPIGPAGSTDSPAFGLTPTETRVLRLLTTGGTTSEIAAALVVAVSTVDRHLTHIYQKLGVRNRAEAVSLALQRGVV